MYKPKVGNEKLAAIAVSGPFGAVKEQSSGLYAQTLAERGFLTIAFDPSFTGESGGEPRYVASPDINTEDFCAAVDYLATNDKVDPNRIGIIGICGWGGLALNAAVLARAGTLMVERMGSTMAALCFTRRGVTACNIGDSRVYILRDGALRQLSVDHVEHWEGRKKTPLTQHLGLDPEELRLEPSICEEALRGGDRFLLCSDGLSDMLEDERIAELLAAAPGAEQAARSLLDAALEQGGRDNTTVIVCCLTDAAK